MKLIAKIPLDENFDKTQKILETYSYRKTYTTKLCPPNLIEYEIDSHGEYGSELLKKAFIKIYSESRFKEHYNFEVIE